MDIQQRRRWQVAIFYWSYAVWFIVVRSSLKSKVYITVLRNMNDLKNFVEREIRALYTM